MTKDANVAEAGVVPKFIMLHGERNSWVETPRDPRFFEALRNLRTTFGEQLGAMADKYGIAVEPELASIFPLDATNPGRHMARSSSLGSATVH